MTTDINNQRISITWGDAGENHVGMEMIGNLQEKGTGFTCKDLKNISKYISSNYECKTEFINLQIKNSPEAGVLIIRNFINNKIITKLFNELTNLSWDTKYYDRRRKKVLNKIARSNLLFQLDKSQKPNYQNGKGTIIDINKLKYFKKIHKALSTFIKRSLKNIKTDTKWVDLIAEANYYYDPKKCGIGYHGDTERTRVICLSVGSEKYPMAWQWFKNYKPIGKTFNIKLNSGDLYIMSEKAVGNDWKRPSIYSLRHSAGHDKYRSLDKYNK